VLDWSRKQSRSTKSLVAEYRQLARPPLREAVIDLRLAEDLPVSVVDEIGRERLPDFEPPIQMWRARIAFPVGPPTATPVPVPPNATEPLGWRYNRSDGSRIIQLRRDGLTFSVLQGYTTWAEARDLAHRVVRQYCGWVRGAAVTRIALRYINVLAVPVGVDFDLYLTAGPRIPPGVPDVLIGFLHRVVIPFPHDGASAIITQALEQSNEATSSVVLDIDVWRESRWQLDSPEIWATFDILRDIKNRIFFGSVTERALEPYA
jgi:uncharacterized protein (TIGR04255 family)